MTQRGIYAAPDNVRANRDREVVEVHPEDWMSDTQPPKEGCVEVKKRLWTIEFDVKDVGKGCAVVKADNPEAATRILKVDGVYNGTPYVYKITRVEEIIPSPEDMLLAETIVSDGAYSN